ncbi:MAG: PEP-CTERM sorting domain-containing protein [Akkermansia sp.]|nr:PEP-CTERM sorting domain-containing protein [Akkermansia sp.]
MANTNLCGGQLTLDVSNGNKINLDLTLDGEFYDFKTRQQIVLFTGVNGFELKGYDERDYYTISSYDGSAVDFEFVVCYTLAKHYFENELLNKDAFLVWDASAGVVYLDVVPEPTTVTLSMLALMGLAARRRRK